MLSSNLVPSLIFSLNLSILALSLEVVFPMFSQWALFTALRASYSVRPMHIWAMVVLCLMIMVNFISSVKFGSPVL